MFKNYYYYLELKTRWMASKTEWKKIFWMIPIWKFNAFQEAIMKSVIFDNNVKGFIFQWLKNKTNEMAISWNHICHLHNIIVQQFFETLKVRFEETLNIKFKFIFAIYCEKKGYSLIDKSTLKCLTYIKI